jgi:nucleoside-diphosphate-sugar epimerase
MPSALRKHSARECLHIRHPPSRPRPHHEDTASDPLAAFRAANCDYALKVVKQTVAAGVKRFVYVSSVKVNGEHTALAPFTELSAPVPCDPYGVSKYEAELAVVIG